MLLKLMYAVEPIMAMSITISFMAIFGLLEQGLWYILVGYLGAGTVVGFFGLLYYRIKYKLTPERDMGKMCFVFTVACLYWPVYSVCSLALGFNNYLARRLTSPSKPWHAKERPKIIDPTDPDELEKIIARLNEIQNQKK